MSYKIVFFDIDGTLVDDRKQIPPGTVQAIRELQSRGVEAVIATGRAPYFFAPLLETLGIDSYVSLNGAYVVYKGEPVFSREIPQASVKAFVSHAARHRHSLVFESHSAFYTNNDSDPLMLESVTSLRVDLPGYDPEFWQKQPIYQMFLHCESAEEPLYERAVPGLKMIRWHEKAMDVMPDDRSKAQGIEALLAHVGVSPEAAVAFGDGLNDKEMLALVGLGIAMGNAHEELKPYADYITTHVEEDGIGNGLRYAGLID
ncbi:Cof-type HAD-IIB family hydrolase [Paenibacillus ginsengarvi]|uniref:Cof-type HAD-IIB family hydrolase n=1 Tax=Paenibacillus ginsengarvi TaxID=400777 RepID=A0A3B0CN47_9BACL|nr:Cof-type HAD-IIB family hydrolase [Paenibacillus ginsengarvi]RKN85689.1 Cof-type HAD-IIB family hydrolase [Paenibacillus ginsengarvi]